jgi:hypothetical protein
MPIFGDNCLCLGVDEQEASWNLTAMANSEFRLTGVPGTKIPQLLLNIIRGVCRVWCCPGVFTFLRDWEHFNKDIDIVSIL